MLNKLDIKILAYISKFDKISITELLNEFPENKYQTKIRLNLLINNEFTKIILEEIMQEYPNGNGGTFKHPCLKETDNYSITDNGLKFVKDHKIKRIERIIDDIRIALQHIVTTIAISFITASITAWFKLS